MSVERSFAIAFLAFAGKGNNPVISRYRVDMQSRWTILLAFHDISRF